MLHRFVVIFCSNEFHKFRYCSKALREVTNILDFKLNY